jgi:hypothetical protein
MPIHLIHEFIYRRAFEINLHLLSVFYSQVSASGFTTGKCFFSQQRWRSVILNVIPRAEGVNRGTSLVEICIWLRASEGIMDRKTRIAWERREKGLIVAVTEVKYFVIIVVFRVGFGLFLGCKWVMREGRLRLSVPWRRDFRQRNSDRLP